MSDTQAKEAHVKVGDLNVYYRELGSGVPLVLIHGGLANGEIMWQDRPTEMAQRYRVLVPDSRGHGRTDNPSGKLSYPQLADDVVGFIAALGLEKPLILGYSDGAQIGIELGLRHQDKIKALVLGGVVTRPTEQYMATLNAMGFDEPGVVDLDNFASDDPEFLDSIKNDHSYVYGPDYWRRFLPAISELWLGVPNYTDEQLASIAVPTLVISGDRDEGDSAAESYRLYNLLPHGELAIIPNAGHGAGVGDTFWYIVKDFLARQTE